MLINNIIISKNEITIITIDKASILKNNKINTLKNYKTSIDKWILFISDKVDNNYLINLEK